MNWPLEQTLGFIEPHLPRALVPQTEWTAIRQMAGLLPDAISCLYLECRLGERVAPVDLLACMDTAVSTPAELAAAGAAWEQAMARSGAPPWPHLHRFFTVWSRPGTLLQRQIPLIWLECDAPSTRSRAAPSLLLSLDPVALERPGPPTPPSTALHLEVIGAALELLGSGLLQEGGNRAALRSCLEHLPEGGRAAHLSIMSARSTPVLKLNVSLPRAALPDYLRALESPVDGAQLGSVLQSFCPELETVQLDLTLADPLAPRVGLEFFDLGTRGTEPGRQTLLDTCVRSGLCTPEQRDALVLWPCSSRERYRRTSWPSRVDRWVDVKLVHQPGQPLSAKAYLGVRPRFSLL